jgi:hypothetical protein
MYEDEKSYLAVRDMLPASERQDPFTYDVFTANVKSLEKESQRRGLITYRIPVNAATVKTWCEANNQPVCRQSVAAFIATELDLRLRSSGTN